MALARRHLSQRILGRLANPLGRFAKNGLAIAALGLFAAGCGPVGQSAEPNPIAVTDPNAELSFTVLNAEIRQDIITALTNQGIEHWLHEDGSVGFYGRDSDAVDRIGFSAIGEYAARN